MKYYIQISLLLLFCSIQNISSHNLRQISNRDGLSNSSVTCLFQDEKRFLWIGTYDGLNMYDSQKIYVYKPDINNQNSLSSNVIRKIIETDNYLWISTKWGLNKLSQKSNAIEEYYNEFGENSYIAKDNQDYLALRTSCLPTSGTIILAGSPMVDFGKAKARFRAPHLYRPRSRRNHFGGAIWNLTPGIEAPLLNNGSD